VVYLALFHIKKVQFWVQTPPEPEPDHPEPELRVQFEVQPLAGPNLKSGSRFKKILEEPDGTELWQP
jgi:hypothetical protein